MKILVTGVSGYIGSKLVLLLNREGFCVYGLDRYLPDYDNTLMAKFVLADLVTLKPDNPIFDGINVVIHLAGESSVDSDGESHWRNNVQGSEKIFDAAVANKVEQIIFLSSIKAGESGDYSRSKKASEEILVNKCRGADSSYTILRSTIVYGPGMKNGLSAWINRYRGKFIPDVRRSESEIDMIGIDDLCVCLIKCIKNIIVMNKMYLISDGIKYRIREIDAVARNAYKKDGKYISIPKWVLFLLAVLGDSLSGIGIKIPFNSDRYAMLYKHKAYENSGFEKDVGFKASSDFLKEFALIFDTARS